MTMKLYAMTCGWMTMPLGDILEGEEGMIRIPVPAYLIDHPRGRILFDSGMHETVATDAKARLGGMAKYFGVDFQASDHVGAQLGRLDLGVEDVDILVNSHLHFDHAGGNAAIPNSPVLLQTREWEAGMDADLAQANGFQKQDYDTGQDMKLVEGEHDIFGDGSVTCIPTFGHTPGHQSLLLKMDGGDIFLAGDACDLRRSLEGLHLPPYAHDKAEMLASIGRVKEFQGRGARIFFGHDPEFWDTIPLAPTAIT